ncbi:MAG: peptidylprolyl isomerase [Candidatus Colwellbacteria bacterium]|nr:peptidylprolyl isomerase [Candidatus Colwellbacteria bacterium]
MDKVLKSESPAPLSASEPEKNPIIVLATTKGEIAIELFVDKTPVTAGNFLKLAKEGFYNGTKFHRVIKGFMIQGGDPNSKSDNVSLYGRGGPGYTIQDEFVEELSNVRGTIAMANTGQQNSGGSQFFINLVDNIGLDFNKEPLAAKHPVFGRVVSGMNVVDEIANAATGPGDVSVKAIMIQNIALREQ